MFILRNSFFIFKGDLCSGIRQTHTCTGRNVLSSLSLAVGGKANHLESTLIAC